MQSEFDDYGKLVRMATKRSSSRSVAIKFKSNPFFHAAENLDVSHEYFSSFLLARKKRPTVNVVLNAMIPMM